MKKNSDEIELQHQIDNDMIDQTMDVLSDSLIQTVNPTVVELDSSKKLERVLQPNKLKIGIACSAFYIVADQKIQEI